MINFPKVQILDKELNNAMDAEYISLEYNEDFYGIGAECKLVLPISKKALAITKGMYIHLPSVHRSRTAIITGKTFSEGNTDTITLSAYPAKSITKRRVNLRPSADNIALLNFGYDAVPLKQREDVTPANIAAETVLKTYSARHMVSPEDIKRSIAELLNAEDLERGKKMGWLAKHGDVLSDTLENVSKYAEMGYHIYAHNGRLIFDVIEGKNKSRGAADVPIVFSLAASTASEATYSADDSNLKNLIYAEGDTLESGLSAMLVVAEGDIPWGIERREMMLNVSSGNAIETDTEISYVQIAKQSLSQNTATEKVSAGVVTGNDYIFLRDWDIGDIVTVESAKYDYSADIRITGVKESYTATGCSVVPVFGDTLDIRKILKKYNIKYKEIKPWTLNTPAHQ